MLWHSQFHPADGRSWSLIREWKKTTSWSCIPYMRESEGGIRGIIVHARGDPRPIFSKFNIWIKFFRRVQTPDPPPPLDPRMPYISDLPKPDNNRNRKSLILLNALNVLNISISSCLNLNIYVHYICGRAKLNIFAGFYSHRITTNRFQRYI